MISNTKLLCISIFLSVLLNVKATVNYDASNNVKFKYSFDGSETVIVISSSETKSPERNVIVQARLVSSANSTGWNILEVLANQNREDEEQAYYAGYAEGCLSTKLIYQHWYNTVTKFCDGKEATCEKIYDFIKENDNWISGMIKKHKNSNKYWWQVNLLYLQLEGLYQGYSKCRQNNETPLTYRDFLFMNMDGDLEDLSDKFGSRDGPSNALDDHCSAIIKLLPNNKDLFVAHNMWGRYNHMNRILKKYILRYHQLPNSKELIPGEVITMSSYPGVLNSLDDYYIMSSNIVAQETSIENYNENLWKFVKPSKVLTFARAMIANRLATDGKSWTKVFSKYNSGTYNNQWMIVDYNKFTTGKSPRNGLLWILEQLPGHIKAEDQTKILIRNEYWPSYNIAYYTSIFTLSGNDKMVKKYGDWFSYHGAPRAKIMKRDHKRIKALDSLMYFMRSNDYKNDPLSKCNCTPPFSASNAIAARHDLNLPNGTYPFKYVAQRGGGAIDAKITSSALVKKLQFIAISGPTTGISLPVFKWSTSDYDKKLLHLGQPDTWDFEPILTDWVYK